MNKWEYKGVISIEKMNDLGKEGWEAYAVSTDNKGNMLFHMKRTIEEGLLLMGQAKKEHIEALNGERCWYCNKKMTEEEIKKEVNGVKVKNFDDGTVGCSDCMANIYSGN